MKAHDYMQAAIDHAIVREAEIRANDGDRIFSGHAAGWTETPAGTLKVYFVVASGVSTNIPQHMRKNWELNGKRIAAAKIPSKLEEV